MPASLDRDAAYESTRQAIIALPLIKQIKQLMEKERLIVVLGAPGTGKTEQTHLALGNCQTFDLKAEFIRYQHKKHLDMYGKAITPCEAVELRKKSHENKENEWKWLECNYTAIKKNLCETSNPFIVFDEFDLDPGLTLTDCGLKSAQLIFRLADDLQALGKQIVLIGHLAKLSHPELSTQLKDKTIVQTGFFSSSCQRKMLNAMGISDKSADILVKYTKGVPGAYLPFLREAENTFIKRNDKVVYQCTKEEFITQAEMRLTKKIQTQKLINPEAFAFLSNYAHNPLKRAHKISLTKCLDDALRQKLLWTGLIAFSREGKLQISGLVQDLLIREY